MSRTRPLLRVVLVETDGAGTAVTTLARGLRDNGVEVVHAGLLATAEQIVRTVEQEDPDAVGIALPAEAGLLAAVAAGLGELPVFGFGGGGPGAVGGLTAVLDITSSGVNVAEWLAGVTSHSGETPVDRAR